MRLLETIGIKHKIGRLMALLGFISFITLLLQNATIYDNSKFTLAIASHSKRINSTLGILEYYGNEEANCPLISKIVINWIDDIDPPIEITTFQSKIPVNVIKSRKRSLNERFRPDAIETSSIFSMDDDIRISCASLGFAFSIYKEFPERIVGFVPRMHVDDVKGSEFKVLYDHNRAGSFKKYSMILTGAAFISRKYLKLYWSSHELPSLMRDLVDEHFNGEDIAMNYLVASQNALSHPIHVIPLDTWYMNVGTPGISNAKSGITHRRSRHVIINRLIEHFGWNLLDAVTTNMRVFGAVEDDLLETS